MGARPEECPRGDGRVVEVLAHGFRGYEMQANGPVFPALLLQTEGGILAVIVEVGDGELTASGNARARVQIESQNSPIARGKHIVALGQGEQLPDARQAERFGFPTGIGFGALDELGAGRVRHTTIGRRNSAAERPRYL